MATDPEEVRQERGTEPLILSCVFEEIGVLGEPRKAMSTGRDTWAGEQGATTGHRGPEVKGHRVFREQDLLG